jgi:hypothetical protein
VWWFGWLCVVRTKNGGLEDNGRVWELYEVIMHLITSLSLSPVFHEKKVYEQRVNTKSQNDTIRTFPFQVSKRIDVDVGTK